MLLYTPDDVDRQFGMSARTHLTRREIGGVLRALRSLKRRYGNRRGGGEVVASPGEILEPRTPTTTFRRDPATDDTRVRTALAWLEEALLLTREENHVRIFPSALRVSSLDEVKRKLEGQRMNDCHRRSLTTVAAALTQR